MLLEPGLQLSEILFLRILGLHADEPSRGFSQPFLGVHVKLLVPAVP
jgi:hypothetical protein